MSVLKTLPPTVAAAVAAGINPVQAMREFLGYSLEELAVACGLAIDELSVIEGGEDLDPSKLRRIAHAFGLPDDAIALS